MVRMFSLRRNVVVRPRAVGSFALGPIVAAALSSCFALSAHAALIVSGSTGGALTGYQYETFDNLALGNPHAPVDLGAFTVRLSGTAKVVRGNRSGRYAAPYVSGQNGRLFGNANGPDASTYLSTGDASISLVFANPQTYFGLLWGSIDGYNSLEFYNGANSVGRLRGRDVIASPNGDQGVNGTLYVNVNSTLAFDKVIARSSSYAFEFDNVSFGARRSTLRESVPAPQSGVLLGLGLIAAAGLTHRSLRRKSRRRMFG